MQNESLGALKLTDEEISKFDEWQKTATPTPAMYDAAKAHALFRQNRRPRRRADIQE